MKKIAAVLGPLLVLLFVPLFAAAFLVSAQTPAVAEQIRATQCSSAAIPATGAWRPPFAQAYALTSGYGQRYDPVYLRWQLHAGQDLASLPGPGPVVAAAAGTISHAGTLGGYGNALIIDHGGGLQSLYGHMASINPGITVGATAWMGRPLGVEGSTGASTGNHLHFELRQNGTPLDPIPFMLAHGAPLTGQAVAPSPPPGAGTAPTDVEGGIGFALPAPGPDRQASLTNPALPIPENIKTLYVAAAARYKLPWTLLAGIGMEETGHGRTEAVSSAGAQGLMQFMPATWATYGVDGDGDGRAIITNDADSIYTAANYLTKLGVSTGGEAGVRTAIFGYNHATWYVNDVLYYAQAYGGGTILGDPSDCGPGGNGNPNLPPLTGERVATMLTWAKAQIGKPYVFGANGPDSYDCSGFTRSAFAQIGITIPRTAGAQRDWLAAGNGYRVAAGQEHPGDLIFWDSYLGPNQIGHVMIVWDPASKTTIEAQGTSTGIGQFSYASGPTHRIFEIWRIGNLSDTPTSTPG